ncbi:MAG: phage tail tape measure protein [Rhizobiales bacterium]|nr:phage tail tape measure protein [Hyphomicrobiales bacterium]
MLLEARIKDFERNMVKASRTAKRSYDEITAGSSRASRTLSQNMADASAKASSSLAAFGKGFAGGLVAGAVAEFTGAIKGAVASVAALKAESQQAGVAVEPFQKLRAAALEAKVGTDALVDGLKEMQLRIDEFVTTGSGSAAESLQRLGYDADTLKVKLKNPSDLFLELIGRIQRLDQAARIRVADELFGGSAGEQFVRLVDLGAEKVQMIGDEAQSAGRIIDTALVERAAELDRKFNIVADTIRQNLVGAVVAASDAMQPLIKQNEELARSWGDFANNPSASNFGRFMLGSWGGYGPVPAADPAEMRREAARGAALSSLGRTAAPGPVDQSNLPPTPERKPNLLDYDPNGRASSASAARTERDAVNDLITSLEEELRLVNETDVERAVSNNLRAAGATATETQRQRIEDLTRAYYAEADAVEATRQAQEAAQEAQRFFADAAYSAIDGLLIQGDSLNEVFANLAKTIAEAALQAALLGQGPLAGILGLGGGSGGGGTGGIIGAILSAITGGMTGGATGGLYANGAAFSRGRVTPFARGGIVSSPTLFPMANGAGLMGEAGPEAVMPLARASNGKLGVRAGSGSAPRSLMMSSQVNIDLRGTTGDKELDQKLKASAGAAYGQAMKDAKKSVMGWIAEHQMMRG